MYKIEDIEYSYILLEEKKLKKQGGKTIEREKSRNSENQIKSNQDVVYQNRGEKLWKY